MTDPKHITAAELRDAADEANTWTASELILRAAATIDAKDARIRSDYELVSAYDNYGSGDLSVCLREMLRILTADHPQAFAKLEADLAAAKARCERLEQALRQLGECGCCEQGEVCEVDDDGSEHQVRCGECDGDGLCDEARAALANGTEEG